jgi:hypothetical protein
VAFCTKCGTAIPDSASLCALCAAVTSGQQPPPAFAYQPQSAAAAATAPAVLYYVSTFATGQVTGPFSEEAVHSLIVQQRITINDSVAQQGSQIWMPVMQSRFAALVSQQANLNRIAASTCPRCSAGMVVIIKRSGLGLGLFIAGLALTPVFGIGLPLLIIGLVLRWGTPGTAAYRCPRCNFST